MRLVRTTLVLSAFLLGGCASQPQPAVSDDSGPRAASGAGTPAALTPASSAPEASVPLGTGHGVVGPDGVAAFDTMPAEAKKALRGARVFFGHQSVGGNIIEGASALGYSFSSVSASSDFAMPKLGEAPVAENHDPHRKISSFSELLLGAKIGLRADVAGFKLCYVDFGDVGKLAGLREKYVATMVAIKKEYPALRLFHVTPPLTTKSAAENRARLGFGTWLKSTYAAKDVVFDLAAVESTKEGGFACDEDGIAALCPEYASDEGHLGKQGAQRAAKAFLYALARSLGSAT